MIGNVEVVLLPILFDLIELTDLVGGDIVPEVFELECRDRVALSAFSLALTTTLHSLVNCNKVSGKFGGVAGVFAGVFIY